MRRHSESDGECFAPEVVRQLIEDLEIQIKLPIFLVNRKSRVKLDWEHVEGPLQFILHRNTLT